MSCVSKVGVFSRRIFPFARFPIAVSHLQPPTTFFKLIRVDMSTSTYILTTPIRKSAARPSCALGYLTSWLIWRKECDQLESKVIITVYQLCRRFYPYWSGRLKLIRCRPCQHPPTYHAPNARTVRQHNTPTSTSLPLTWRPCHVYIICGKFRCVMIYFVELEICRILKYLFYVVTIILFLTIIWPLLCFPLQQANQYELRRLHIRGCCL